MEKILIVDDDPDIGSLLKNYLKRRGYDVENVHSGMSALKNIIRSKPDLLLLDYRLPDVSGEEVLDKVREDHPGVKVIVITGYGDVKTAIKTIKRGAFDYVTKPIQPEEILMRIKEALSDGETGFREEKKQDKKNGKSIRAGSARKRFIEGESAASLHVKKLTDLVAPTDMSVVILGETGTGKEYVARRIHKKSKRNEKPFVAVDCGALSESLAGSTLFGHVKGAFTGAVKDKIGCFELAAGGTLFLDEVGNLTYENQVKLLRVLEERQIVRLGGSKSVNVDVRVLTATNDSLIDAVNKGEFREDLYHRLNEFKIELPPLRKRQEDLELFTQFFIERSNEELGKHIEGLSSGVKRVFGEYPWFGNLRELKNTVKRAVLMEQGKVISLEALPAEMVSKKWDSELEDTGQEVITLKEAVAKAEKHAILRAFKAVNGNKSKAAKVLKVDRKTLYNKLDRYNINL